MTNQRRLHELRRCPRAACGGLLIPERDQWGKRLVCSMCARDFLAAPPPAEIAPPRYSPRPRRTFTNAHPKTAATEQAS